MLEGFWKKMKKNLFKIRSYIIAKMAKICLNVLFKTCRIHVSGVVEFCEMASKEKCLLMLWHNRLAIVPFILSKYTHQLRFAALVSASRDGDMLSYLIHSYSRGNTIRVPHLGRYQALNNVIRHVEEGKEIVIITPDGPRGPRYELKPGIAVAALETQAYVFSFDWEAKRFWEFKTWNKFRLPKPFTTIFVKFNPPICFDKAPQPSLAEAQNILRESLMRGQVVLEK